MANYRHARPCEGAVEASGTLTQRNLSGLRQGGNPDGATAGRCRLVQARARPERLGAGPVPVAEAGAAQNEGLVRSQPLYGSQARALSLDDVENETILREALRVPGGRVCAEKAIDAALVKTHRATDWIA